MEVSRNRRHWTIASVACLAVLAFAVAGFASEFFTPADIERSVVELLPSTSLGLLCGPREQLVGGHRRRHNGRP